ncbi:MAG TPA: hypothetical protein VLH61_03460 [Bacteroidales bacterium]|nr:hypothetical protein [Bacteroidales bacterium]
MKKQAGHVSGKINRHVFFDRLAIWLISLLMGRKKYFSKSIEADPFERHLEEITFALPDLLQKGDYELAAKGLSGDFDPAIKVVQWLGYDYPTIVYHHDFNERPFDLDEDARNTFFQLFIKWPRRIPANLFLLRAPFHNGRLRDYFEKMTDLNQFMAMLSVQVKITEGVVKQFRRRSSESVIVTGVGLGGWITNLHRAYFNSAHAYIPILAGAKLDEMLLTSGFRHLCSKEALKNRDLIYKKISFFYKYRMVTTSNLYPVLARYDQLVDFTIQKPAYNGFPLRTFNSGHISAILRPALYREHILEVLQMYS